MTTIILPGMGANSNMYPKDKYQFLEDVSFINWPVYKGEQSLNEVARSIIRQYTINNKMIVGGSSLGGMVAIDIAKIVGNEKVILIGSATQPKYINPLLQKLSDLADYTAVKIIQVFAGKVNQYSNNDLLGMFEESNSEFIRAMCKTLFEWEGLGDYKCKVCQIHGKQDMVISPPNANVKIIPEGGHLISMSHADVVANFINENIR